MLVAVGEIVGVGDREVVVVGLGLGEADFEAFEEELVRIGEDTGVDCDDVIGASTTVYARPLSPS